MIKFFRNIRKNLLSQGRTGKYLKYAVGEIILVVIGILIALQINTWNENKKLNAIKDNNYVQLLEDLKTDKDYIDEVIKEYKSNILLYQAYLKTYKTPNLTLDDVMNNQNQLDFSVTTIRFQNSTITSLENTGEIKLIPSELRRKLTDFKRNQDYATETNNDGNDYFFDRMEMAGITGSQPDFQNRIKNHPLLREALGIQENLPKIIGSIEISMLYKNFTERETVYNLEKLLVDIQEITSLINNERNK
ncbi:hypothetical protein KXJ69_08065 [Aureisphaera sp. CAU 1614]|uniref:Uncharacterized protein n=1 Tax=Halomarinibacterium sedimenti TaxID=2857106 RepID=A0A9X1JXF0_9FLAO|nr:DUF6090 family protein [Halomarinibacterium sedimenti]MBW2938058.1 hypothetical protein [Halomarinibacterium sedimenti]